MRILSFILAAKDPWWLSLVFIGIVAIWALSALAKLGKAAKKSPSSTSKRDKSWEEVVGGLLGVDISDRPKQQAPPMPPRPPMPQDRPIAPPMPMPADQRWMQREEQLQREEQQRRVRAKQVSTGAAPIRRPQGQQKQRPIRRPGSVAAQPPVAPPPVVSGTVTTGQATASAAAAAPAPVPPDAFRASKADIAASEIRSHDPAAGKQGPMADAAAIAHWLRPATLHGQFILTEILQPPLAMREERYV